MTECKPKPIEFHTLGSRDVVAHFDGGDITSDAGGLMLREVEQRSGILKQFVLSSISLCALTSGKTTCANYMTPEMIWRTPRGRFSG